MQRSPVSPKLYFYENPAVHLSAYRTVIIDPVIVYFRPGNQHAAIDTQSLKKLTDLFDAQLRETLAQRYTVVSDADTHALRLRVAITDVIPAKPFFNIEPTTKIFGLGLGGASMEAEFIDQETNTIVFALIDSRVGKRRQYVAGLKRWGHTEQVLSQWADMLAQGLETITQAPENTRSKGGS